VTVNKMMSLAKLNESVKTNSNPSDATMKTMANKDYRVRESERESGSESTCSDGAEEEDGECRDQ
jgi:hypothetical protein